MFNGTRIIKLIACTTLCAFVYSFIIHEPLYGISIAAADNRAAADLKSRLNSFLLPYQYGRVVDSRYNGDSRLIVYIQDLHCNEEAQKNICSILKLFDSRYGVRRIFVEGAASGKVDTSLLSAMPDERMKKKVLDNLMAKGIVGGAEYYSVMEKQDKLYGIEEWDTYVGNAARIRKLIENKERNKALADRLGKDIEALKKKYLSAKIQRLERNFRAREGKKQEKYYLALAKLGAKAGEDVSAYPHLSKYIRMMRLNREIRFNRLSGELNTYVNELKQTIPFSLYQSLSEKLNKDGKLEEYYFCLSEVARRYSPDLERRYPSVGKFLEYVRCNYTINPVYLLEEEQAYRDRVLERHADRLLDRELLFLSSMSGALSDMVELKLTTGRYDYVTKNADRFAVLLQKYFAYRDIAPVINFLRDRDIPEFYKTNLCRNDIFIRNIGGAGRREQPAPEGRSPHDEAGGHALGGDSVFSHLNDFKDIDVVITGGFHTDAICALGEKGISYVVVTPNVTKASDESIYERIITGQIDLKEIASASFAADVAGWIDTTPAGVRTLKPKFEALIVSMVAAGKPEEVIQSIAQWKARDTRLGDLRVSYNASAQTWNITFGADSLEIAMDGNAVKDILVRNPQEDSRGKRKEPGGGRFIAIKDLFVMSLVMPALVLGSLMLPNIGFTVQAVMQIAAGLYGVTTVGKTVSVIFKEHARMTVDEEFVSMNPFARAHGLTHVYLARIPGLRLLERFEFAVHLLDQFLLLPAIAFIVSDIVRKRKSERRRGITLLEEPRETTVSDLPRPIPEEDVDPERMEAMIDEVKRADASIANTLEFLKQAQRSSEFISRVRVIREEISEAYESGRKHLAVYLARKYMVGLARIAFERKSSIVQAYCDQTAYGVSACEVDEVSGSDSALNKTYATAFIELSLNPNLTDDQIETRIAVNTPGYAGALERDVERIARAEETDIPGAQLGPARQEENKAAEPLDSTGIFVHTLLYRGFPDVFTLLDEGQIMHAVKEIRALLLRSGVENDDRIMALRRLDEWISVDKTPSAVIFADVNGNTIFSADRATAGRELLKDGKIGVGTGAEYRALMECLEGRSPVYLDGTVAGALRGARIVIPAGSAAVTLPKIPEVLAALSKLDIPLGRNAYDTRSSLLLLAAGMYTLTAAMPEEGLDGLLEIIEALENGESIGPIDRSYLLQHPNEVPAAFAWALYSRAMNLRKGLFNASIVKGDDLSKVVGPVDPDPMAVLAAAMKLKGITRHDWDELTAAFTEWRNTRDLKWRYTRTVDAWYESFLRSHPGMAAARSDVKPALLAVFYDANGYVRPDDAIRRITNAVRALLPEAVDEKSGAGVRDAEQHRERLKGIVAQLPADKKNAILGRFRTLGPEGLSDADIIAAIGSFLSGSINAGMDDAAIVRALEEVAGYARATTGFFRKAFSWEDELRDYIAADIAAKVKNKDLSMVIKSVGAATGEEPYTLALILHSELENFYKNNEAGIKGASGVSSFEEWVSSWDIEIDAYDKSLLALYEMKEGRYKLIDDEDEFGEPEYGYDARKELHDPRYWDAERGRDLPRYRIKDVFRRWVRPVYVDLAEDNAVEIIQQKPADVLFLLHVAYYFELTDKGRGTRLIEEMKRCFDPGRGGLYVYENGHGVEVEKIVRAPGIAGSVLDAVAERVLGRDTAGYKVFTAFGAPAIETPVLALANQSNVWWLAAGFAMAHKIVEWIVRVKEHGWREAFSAANVKKDLKDLAILADLGLAFSVPFLLFDPATAYNISFALHFVYNAAVLAGRLRGPLAAIIGGDSEYSRNEAVFDDKARDIRARYDELNKQYELLVLRLKDHKDFYAQREAWLTFIKDEIVPNKHALMSKWSAPEWLKVRERLIDALGIFRMMAMSVKDAESAERIRDTAAEFSGITETKKEFSDFERFMRGRREALEKAVQYGTTVVFVMGHEAPDPDCTVSAVMEAYRNHLVDGDKVTYVPVIRDSKVSDISWFLFGDLGDSILLTSEPLYKKACPRVKTGWILVDHNTITPDIAGRVVGVVDHHEETPEAISLDIPKTFNKIGSTAAIVFQKLSGLGIDIPEKLAWILHGAALIDTQKRTPEKMKLNGWNTVSMDEMQALAGVGDEERFYGDMKKIMLHENDPRNLYFDTVKYTYSRYFAWSRPENEKFFDNQGAVLKPNLFKQIIEIAQKDVKDRKLLLSLVSMISYDFDGGPAGINRERTYFVCNPKTPPILRESLIKKMEAMLDSAFSNAAEYPNYRRKRGSEEINGATVHYIDFWGVNAESERKVVAPELDVLTNNLLREYAKDKEKFMRQESERVKQLRANNGNSLTIVHPLAEYGMQYDDETGAYEFSADKAFDEVMDILKLYGRNKFIRDYQFGLYKPSDYSKLGHGLDFREADVVPDDKLLDYMQWMLGEYKIDGSWKIRKARHLFPGSNTLYLEIETNGIILSTMFGYDTKMTEFEIGGRKVAHHDRYGNRFSPRGEDPESIFSDEQLKELAELEHSLGHEYTLDDYIWRSPDCLTADNFPYFHYERTSADKDTFELMNDCFPKNVCSNILEVPGKGKFEILKRGYKTQWPAGDQILPDLGDEGSTAVKDPEIKKADGTPITDGDKFNYWINKYKAKYDKFIALGVAGVRIDLAHEIENNDPNNRYHTLWTMIEYAVKQAAQRQENPKFFFTLETYAGTGLREIADGWNELLSKQYGYSPVKVYCQESYQCIRYKEKDGDRFKNDILSGLMNDRRRAFKELIYWAQYDDESLWDLIPERRLRDQFKELGIYLGYSGFNFMIDSRDIMDLNGMMNPNVGGGGWGEWRNKKTHAFASAAEERKIRGKGYAELTKESFAFNVIKKAKHVTDVSFDWESGRCSVYFDDYDQKDFDLNRMFTELYFLLKGVEEGAIEPHFDEITEPAPSALGYWEGMLKDAAFEGLPGAGGAARLADGIAALVESFMFTGGRREIANGDEDAALKAQADQALARARAADPAFDAYLKRNKISGIEIMRCRENPMGMFEIGSGVYGHTGLIRDGATLKLLVGKSFDSMFKSADQKKEVCEAEISEFVALNVEGAREYAAVEDEIRALQARDEQVSIRGDPLVRRRAWHTLIEKQKENYATSARLHAVSKEYLAKTKLPRKLLQAVAALVPAARTAIKLSDLVTLPDVTAGAYYKDIEEGEKSGLIVSTLHYLPDDLYPFAHFKFKKSITELLIDELNKIAAKGQPETARSPAAAPDEDTSSFNSANTRPLERYSESIFRAVVRSAGGHTVKAMDAGAGAGFACSDMNRIAQELGAAVDVESVGLVPFAPHLQPVVSFDTINRYAGRFQKENPDDPVFKGHSLASFTLQELVYLQSRGYRIFEYVPEPFVKKQYIDRFTRMGALAETTYDFIRDELGAFYYSITHDDREKTLGTLSKLLAPNGIFICDMFDLMKKIETVPLPEDLVLVYLKDSGGLIAFKKHGKYESHLALMLQKAERTGNGIYLAENTGRIMFAVQNVEAGTTAAAIDPLKGTSSYFREMNEQRSAYERENTFERVRSYFNKASGQVEVPENSMLYLLLGICLLFGDTPKNDLSVFLYRLSEATDYGKNDATGAGREIGGLVRNMLEDLDVMRPRGVSGLIMQVTPDTVDGMVRDAETKGSIVKGMLGWKDDYLRIVDACREKVREKMPGLAAASEQEKEYLNDYLTYYRNRCEIFFNELQSRWEAKKRAAASGKTSRENLNDIVAALTSRIAGLEGFLTRQEGHTGLLQVDIDPAAGAAVRSILDAFVRSPQKKYLDEAKIILEKQDLSPGTVSELLRTMALYALLAGWQRVREEIGIPDDKEIALFIGGSLSRPGEFALDSDIDYLLLSKEYGHVEEMEGKLSKFMRAAQFDTHYMGWDFSSHSRQLKNFASDPFLNMYLKSVAFNLRFVAGNGTVRDIVAGKQKNMMDNKEHLKLSLEELTGLLGEPKHTVKGVLKIIHLFHNVLEMRLGTKNDSLARLLEAMLRNEPGRISGDEMRCLLDTYDDVVRQRVLSGRGDGEFVMPEKPAGIMMRLMRAWHSESPAAAGTAPRTGGLWPFLQEAFAKRGVTPAGYAVRWAPWLELALSEVVGAIAGGLVYMVTGDPALVFQTFAVSTLGAYFFGHFIADSRGRIASTPSLLLANLIMIVSAVVAAHTMSAPLFMAAFYVTHQIVNAAAHAVSRGLYVKAHPAQYRQNFRELGLKKAEIEYIEAYTESFLSAPGHTNCFKQNKDELLASLADRKSLSIALRPASIKMMEEYSRYHRDFLNNMLPAVRSRLFGAKLLEGPREEILKGFVASLAARADIPAHERSFFSGLSLRKGLKEQGVTLELEDFSSGRAVRQGSIVNKITLKRAGGGRVSIFLKGYGIDSRNRGRTRKDELYETFFFRLVALTGFRRTVSEFFYDNADPSMDGFTLMEEIRGRDTGKLFDIVGDGEYRLKPEYAGFRDALIRDFARFDAYADLFHGGDRRIVYPDRPQFTPNYIFNIDDLRAGRTALNALDHQIMFIKNNHYLLESLSHSPGHGEIGILYAFDQFHSDPRVQEQLLDRYKAAYLEEWDRIRRQRDGIEALISDMFGRDSEEFRIFTADIEQDPSAVFEEQKKALLSALRGRPEPPAPGAAVKPVLRRNYFRAGIENLRASRIDVPGVLKRLGGLLRERIRSGKSGAVMATTARLDARAGGAVEAQRAESALSLESFAPAGPAAASLHAAAGIAKNVFPDARQFSERMEKLKEQSITGDLARRIASSADIIIASPVNGEAARKLLQERKGMGLNPWMVTAAEHGEEPQPLGGAAFNMLNVPLQGGSYLLVELGFDADEGRIPYAILPAERQSGDEAKRVAGGSFQKQELDARVALSLIRELNGRGLLSVSDFKTPVWSFEWDGSAADAVRNIARDFSANPDIMRQWDTAESISAHVRANIGLYEVERAGREARGAGVTRIAAELPVTALSREQSPASLRSLLPFVQQTGVSSVVVDNTDDPLNIDWLSEMRNAGLQDDAELLALHAVLKHGSGEENTISQETLAASREAALGIARKLSQGKDVNTYISGLVTEYLKRTAAELGEGVSLDTDRSQLLQGEFDPAAVTAQIIEGLRLGSVKLDAEELYRRDPSKADGFLSGLGEAVLRSGIPAEHRLTVAITIGDIARFRAAYGRYGFRPAVHIKENTPDAAITDAAVKGALLSIDPREIRDAAELERILKRALSAEEIILVMARETDDGVSRISNVGRNGNPGLFGVMDMLFALLPASEVMSQDARCRAARARWMEAARQQAASAALAPFVTADDPLKGSPIARMLVTLSSALKGGGDVKNAVSDVNGIMRSVPAADRLAGSLKAYADEAENRIRADEDPVTATVRLAELDAALRGFAGGALLALAGAELSDPAVQDIFCDAAAKYLTVVALDEQGRPVATGPSGRNDGLPVLFASLCSGLASAEMLEPAIRSEIARLDASALSGLTLGDAGVLAAASHALSMEKEKTAFLNMLKEKLRKEAAGAARPDIVAARFMLEREATEQKRGEVAARTAGLVKTFALTEEGKEVFSLEAASRREDTAALALMMELILDAIADRYQPSGAEALNNGLKAGSGLLRAILSAS